MIFGLTIEKLVVIAVIAGLLLGPERLPRYAAMLAQLVRRGRDLLSTAKDRMRDELGDDVDWHTLDPRQYDPRRIIREALLEEPVHVPSAAVAATAAAALPAFSPDAPVPFDSEAT